MANIYRPCISCGREIEMNVAQSVYDQKLFWHISYACPYCGHQIEIDEDGIPPKDIRDPIIAAYGQYKLIVQEINSKRIIAMKVLRSALNLSLDEAMKLKKKIPGTVIIGTKAEVYRLQQILNDNNLNAWIEEE
jgi:DNA-directed RNA polymerase subunit RPC12/RpoP